ncbi:MAG: hypothetical protein AVDCRST_MAG12-411, partial [uncultured Rubrobacteraceae bacterium]
ASPDRRPGRLALCTGWPPAHGPRPASAPRAAYPAPGRRPEPQGRGLEPASARRDRSRAAGGAPHAGRARVRPPRDGAL